MIIIGFDVSLRRTGVAVLGDGEYVGHAVISTSAKDPRYKNLHDIENQADRYIVEYEPDIIAIETSAAFQRMSNNSRVSIEALAQARAAVLIAADWGHKNFGAKIIELDPHDVRETVCANRNASKLQVQENLRVRGYILPVMANGKVDPDVADALACAVAVWSTERLLAMAATYKEVG